MHTFTAIIFTLQQPVKRMAVCKFKTKKQKMKYQAPLHNIVKAEFFYQRTH